MPKHHKLSIIVVFHNQREVIESTIGAIYNLQNTDFELFIINDGSTDDTTDIIQSLLQYYQHEETYYYEHDEKTGTGRSINEALDNITGQFVWVTGALDSIDEIKLQDAMADLEEYKNSCAVQNLFFGNFDTQLWASKIIKGQIPDNQYFLWNWPEVAIKNQVFNPFLDTANSFELAIRTIHKNNFNEINPFFTSSETGTSELELSVKKELLFSLTRRPSLDSPTVQRILQDMVEIELSFVPKSEESDDEEVSEDNFDILLAEADNLYNDGNNRASLDILNRLLEYNPNDEATLRLKIAVLEKMHHFVEAVEIKQRLKNKKKNIQDALDSELAQSADMRIISEKQDDDSVTEPGESWAEEYQEPEEIVTSIIIPTASDRKPLLEECLVSLGKYCSPQTTELILIDNASLDDTCDYLDQLEQEHFLNCKVIVNHHNNGFARSINQGIEIARGTYICVLHNDVVLHSDAIEELRKALEGNEDYGIVGPLANKSLNSLQIADSTTDEEADLVETDYIDSFCMMFRRNSELKFDENYGPAYFDDVDFCLQIRSTGKKAGIVKSCTVDHHYGVTTTDFGYNPNGTLYWKNTEYFNKKWNLHDAFPKEELEKNVAERLIILNEIMNPFYPEPHLKELFDQWFTSEVKTMILETQWNREYLIAFSELMMKMEQRDVLRQLEEKLVNFDLGPDLIYKLASFYYSHSIYSRSRFYINELNGDGLPFRFRLILLKIAIGEKDMETAIPLLTELLHEIPSHPDLYRLSGELHDMQANHKEAQRFYEIATQLDPFRYPVQDENYQFEN